MSNIHLWMQNESIQLKTDLQEHVIKISNIQNHLFLLTANHNLYHGYLETDEYQASLDLQLIENIKLIDIDSCRDYLYTVNQEGIVHKRSETLEVVSEIVLQKEYVCSRGHNGTKNRVKVKTVAVGEFGQLFITECGSLWGCGNMPQIGINSETPKLVEFFAGRTVYDVNVGHDFAIATVSKQKLTEADSEEEEVFPSNCPQCLSASQLTSPGSLNSISEACPLGKVQGSYDIETTSTSSKNDSSISSIDNKLNEETKENDGKERNIIFRNTEAAKEFLTRQISRMSSAGEEYLVECTEKPTRIIKENMTNVASFVYEGVKTVGDKVVTLSRHVSGSSDCNSAIENNEHIVRTSSKEEFSLSCSQATSERDISQHDVKEIASQLISRGLNLLNCEVWTWGNIFHGQLGVGDKIKRERPMIITKLSNIGVKKTSVQSSHVAVLTLDGRAYIWGENSHHQVTTENSNDQSSPKLFSHKKGERVKDIVCGEQFTIILSNNLNAYYFGRSSSKVLNLPLPNTQDNETEHININNNNLLCTKQFTLLNAIKYPESLFLKFLVEEQMNLEEMICIQQNLIKSLQKKTGSPNCSVFEDLCQTYTDLLHFWAANVDSLIEATNDLIQMTEIITFKYFEEHIFIYKRYIEVLLNVVSIDGFQTICKLIEIHPSLYKLRPDVFSKKDKNNEEQIVATFLAAPLDRLDNFSAIVQYLCVRSEQKNKDILNRWNQFVEEVEGKKKLAEATKDFWLTAGKGIEYLKEPNRRIIKDSKKDLIQLQNASRFSSHWFVLFNDLFAHLNGSSSNVHNLSVIWIEPQQEEQQYQLCLKMPEDSLILFTNDAENKIEWFHALQTAIKIALNKPDSLQPSNIRSGSYTFTKSGFLKDAKYTGRWLNAKMHGTGKLEWPDGKIYTGHFSNNQLNGYGIMKIPNVGTYEGQWKDNLQNGLGIFTYCNTDVYKGHFKDGQPHGHGILRKGSFKANEASLYIGDWINGQKNGYGVMDDIVTGERYIGSWVDNKKQGNGLIITYDGIYYEGSFNQDILTGQGIMILEDDTHYEGEFKGTGILNGKGVLTLPSGHVIEGVLSGTLNDGLKINGVFNKGFISKLPKSFETLCAPVNQKWKALFKHCHQVLGIPETNNKNNGKSFDTQRIWQNVAVSLSNATSLKRSKTEKYKNGLNNLDFIPPFGRDKLDMGVYLEIRKYLLKAFDNSFHPLGSLLSDLTEAYTTTYAGKPHPLLLRHAITELMYIIKRLYEIVVSLFPALPAYGKDVLLEDNTNDEVVNYQSLLYPIILPKVHHPLFTLFVLNNINQDKQYKKTLAEWNKQSDYTLMSFLSVDQKFFNSKEAFPQSPARNQLFLEAVETLQQIKCTFSPTEKLIVIRQTVEKMTPVAQSWLGKSYAWNMDDLFPIFLYVVVRARISDLGSELDFIDNFMDPSLESGELGIMFTTLKACYQQILQEKSSTY